MPKAPTTPTLVDEMTGQTRQGCYSLHRVYKVGAETVRVRITRDFYAHQSHAAADLLAADRTWTTLVTNPASNWHKATDSLAKDPATELDTLATGLIQRAARVLA